MIFNRDYRIVLKRGVWIQKQQIREANYSGIILAVCILCAVVLLMIPACARDEELPSDEAIVNAIGKAENSKKFPYGIKSVKCDGEKECRKICLNSVRNAKKRWIKAGKPEDFITFMGRRYSPPNINPNWIRLVKYFLKEV